MKGAAATLIFLLMSVVAEAEIIRCQASASFANRLFPSSYEIVLPDDGSSGFVGHLFEGGDVQEIMALTQGLGIIEVKLVRSLSKATRHVFVLLQRPSTESALLGLYFTGLGKIYPTVVRADLFDDSRQFFVYDAFFPHEVGIGKCE